MTRISTATFAVDTAIMASGDTVATAVIEFKDVVNVGQRIGRIRRLVMVSPDAVSAANSVSELWLFSATVTPAAANAAHSISDAHALLSQGNIPITSAGTQASALNTVSLVQGLDHIFEVAAGATSLFGILITRATPTYAGGSLTITLAID